MVHPLLVTAALASAGRARAQDARAPVDVRAENVEIDAKSRELDLRGDVRIDSPPFHLRSDALRVRRSARGVEVDGAGKLAFCPCLGAPLAVRFEHATVAPPGDLLLKEPVLEIYGVPAFWLPYFWLRSTARVGLLPPDLSYRGGDGVYVGGGAHVPWALGDSDHALDLRAGAYLAGGAAVDARISTPASETRARWDHLHGDGLSFDTRGAFVSSNGSGSTTSAWDVDLVRGARGVASTTDLEVAARPFDRAAVETSWRSGGWTLATAVRTTSPRGSDVLDLGATGPVAVLRRAEAIASAGAYDATVEGGALRDAAGTATFARGDLGAMLADRFGPFGASIATRGAGSVASNGEREGIDGAASARIRVGLPLARGFASYDPTDPWLHRIEPAVEAGAIAVRGSDVLGAVPGRGNAAIRGESWLAEARVASALGRWGAKAGGELTLAGGALGSIEDGTGAFATRGRASASGTALGLGAEGGRVWSGAAPGGAFAMRLRVGPQQGPNAGLTLAERDGVDPVAARVLTDSPFEPSGGFLSATGWTGGARISIPWSQSFLTRAGADVDLTTRDLVAARASFELRDHCGCIVLRGTGAHRIGRDGVDVWLTIELAPAL